MELVDYVLLQLFRRIATAFLFFSILITSLFPISLCKAGQELGSDNVTPRNMPSSPAPAQQPLPTIITSPIILMDSETTQTESEDCSGEECTN